MKIVVFLRWWLSGALVLSLAFAAARAAETDPATIAAAEQWSAWQINLQNVMEACVTAKESSCLAKAFRDHPRPPIDNPLHTVTGDLFYDLRTAMAMLAVPSVADALWREYGLDSVAYLGTGYSVPMTQAGVAPYWAGEQREYFVPNLCAQTIDPVMCPTADPDVWTWRLTGAQLRAGLDRPVASILKGNTRKLMARVRAAPRGDGLPNALVRFGLLDPSSYKGSFGRPGAARVFFADYAQVSGKTLRQALIATGASTLIANPDPHQEFFIWIYAPGAQSKAVPASWHALFEALAQD
jgi:hypothetical protein